MNYIYTGYDRHLVVIGSEYIDYYAVAYRDFHDMENVTVIPSSSGIEFYARRIHLSEKISRYVHLPFIKEWVKRDARQIGGFEGKQLTFLLIESPEARNVSYVSSLRKMYPCSKIALSVLNPIEQGVIPKWISSIVPYCDMIITCNESDANTYNWVYWPDCYSKAEIEVPDQPEYDVVFIGKDKGRLTLLEDIYSDVSSKGMRCNFIIEKPEHSVIETEGMRFIKTPMSYEEYLRNIVNSKCILEIVLGGLNYSTLRTMEALFYGKSLITTNTAIINEEFYNSEQIHVVSDAKEVAQAIHKSNNNYNINQDVIDYFSPKRLVRFLLSEF